MNSSLFRYAVILAAAAAACNAQEEPRGETQAAPGSATGDPAVVHHPEPPKLPTQKSDSIPVEGTYERITAQLVQSNADPSFATYLPPRMIYELVSSDEGDGHFFFTNFAGRRNDDMYVLVFIYPARTTEAQARNLAESFVSSRNPLPRPPIVDRYQESLFERRFFFKRGNITFFGFIALAKHGDRYFHYAMQYPQEASDGFGPRADYIRKHWVWLDDGQGLGLTSPPPRGSPE
jgi:hypothetical protein